MGPTALTPSEQIVADEGAQLDFSKDMSYGDYLHLDELLGAQHPLSPDHNEMLFIIQHQTSELWMKLLLHELAAAITCVASDDLGAAFKMLARVSKIMEQLVHAWDVLATMTPPEYSRIRPYLSNSSGFQSAQYRCIEFMLGNKNAAMLKPHAHRPDLLARVEAAWRAPSLYDESLRLLARRGLAVPADHLDRNWTQPYQASDAVEQAWLVAYRDPKAHWDLYQLGEELTDLEDTFRLWRFRHVTTVETRHRFQARHRRHRRCQLPSQDARRGAVSGNLEAAHRSLTAPMGETRSDRSLESRRVAMLLDTQRRSFDYFIHEFNPDNGMVADKTAPGWPASIAAMGMALTAWTVGVERHYTPRAAAVTRSLTMLRFLMASEQSDSPTATGHQGFYYHFLDMQTGQRAWNCELSSIDTALLMAGVLTARAYYQHDTPEERELRELADAVYRRVDWNWMRAGGPALCHGWLPDQGFLPWHWRGYDEALILYLLALGSPTHPVGDDAYAAWTSTYEWKHVEGIDYLHAGPLFTHQMSHVWVDFKGIRDAFMRERDSDYFENSRRAARVQQRYAIRNPNRMAMYAEDCWGLTACDGPGGSRRGQHIGGHTYYDYVARGVPDGPDDGTLAPWAVVASLPFAPEIVLPTLERFQALQLHLNNRYGFKASFNATFPGDRRHTIGWTSLYHFGINEGPAVMMIENHLSGMLWRLTRQCPYLVAGLRRAGFQGGWLDPVA